jgi:hypothetical protein
MSDETGQDTIQLVRDERVLYEGPGRVMERNQGGGELRVELVAGDAVFFTGERGERNFVNFNGVSFDPPYTHRLLERRPVGE